MPVLTTRFLSAGILSIVSLAGCSPSLSPLYRDYEVGDPAETVVVRVEDALEADGWELVESSVPNMVRTADRTLNRRLIYKTVVSLEIVPIEGQYVRVFIHPYRDNLIGGKSKIPYLPSNIRRQVVPSITEALEAQGLRAVGAVREGHSVASN